jgi:hypothetical protein
MPFMQFISTVDPAPGSSIQSVAQMASHCANLRSITSFTEAERIACCDGIKHVMSLAKLLEELGFTDKPKAKLKIKVLRDKARDSPQSSKMAWLSSTLSRIK